MARLLVSVRSESEARAALSGGASIIDVKEPSRGPLGMSSWPTWRRVRNALPPSTIVSVALGELTEWSGAGRQFPAADHWHGVDYCKIGLAGAPPAWRDRWRDFRQHLGTTWKPRGNPGDPRWVAVAYLDWEAARAPEPDEVIGEALAIADCAGVLFDTWEKSRRMAFEPNWEVWLPRIQRSGRFVALAGSLDEDRIRRLRPLDPDLFAVRGAACRGGDRNAAVDPERVARLAEACQPAPTSNRTPCANGSSRP